jgi:ubiquinone/menaquinone biosynthesis C-methylase UbiE
MYEHEYADMYRLENTYWWYIARRALAVELLNDEIDGRNAVRILDVGCGTGALTSELARRLPQNHIAAVDPSEPSAQACASAVPAADVRVSPAESLPFDDDSFDIVLSQLVVNFLTDAEQGVHEMRRVVRPGGTIAACTWDYGDGMTMLRAFWDSAAALDPDAPDEARTMRYCTRDELAELWRRAGLTNVESGDLLVERAFADYDELWEPFTLGVGPGGAYTVSLDPDAQESLRTEVFRRLGSPSDAFTLTARAWVVRGTAPLETG